VNCLLITGGAGFIGFNLVQYVLQHTVADVVVVDKVTYAAHPETVTRLRYMPRVRFIQEDIANGDAIARIITMHRPGAILNLAAETHVDRSIDSPGSFVSTNVVGTYTLLERARAYFQTLDTHERMKFRFLHVSTDEVYGTLGSTGAFTEKTPYAPNSPYAASKAAADHLVRAYRSTYGLPTLITNCSNNYGPFQHTEKLIPLTILNGLQGRRLPIYGTGGNVRDWLHVDDHCAAIMTVLEHGHPGDSYNIGASNERANIEVVDLICDALEAIRPAETNPALCSAGSRRYHDLKQFVTDRPGHDHRYAVDPTKIRSELGWRPQFTFEAGLRSTVEWYVEHELAFGPNTSGYDRERLGLTSSIL